MHALLITFTSAASLDDLAGPFTDYAHAMHDVGGLIAKTWIVDGSTVGGFHTFTDEASIDAYLAGALFQGVATNPAFSNFEIRRFGVIDGLTALTSPAALAGAS
ncbi:MAG: YdhR family protein [Ilumatobacteraceae bacterium]